MHLTVCTQFGFILQIAAMPHIGMDTENKVVWPHLRIHASPFYCSPGRAPCKKRAASPRSMTCQPSLGRKACGRGGREGTSPAGRAAGTHHKTCNQERDGSPALILMLSQTCRLLPQNLQVGERWVTSANAFLKPAGRRVMGHQC